MSKEYIAKRIRRHSNEVQILRLLLSSEPPCDYVVQILETVKSKVNTFIVFPKLRSIFEELQLGGRVLGGRLVDMSRDLAKGLTFLHHNNIAHLDINPSNLCFTDSYCLQIIDFDISVQVDGEDGQIDDYLGTEGWMAPEIGTKNGPRQLYSPIRADRYSCGCVFSVFANRQGKADEGLGKFADRLMDHDPHERPKLIEWFEPATLTQANSEILDVTMVAEEEAMVTEDGTVVPEDERTLKRRRVHTYDGESFDQMSVA
jgi:serine/threonine protein kinase